MCVCVCVCDCVYKLRLLLGYPHIRQAHAARTKHQNFSESMDEIKPLTAEEKAAQLKK